MSGGVLRSESTRPPIPATINTAATIAEWCAGFGLGGRAERARVTGTRATARPGHQAAAVAREDRDDDSHREQCPGQAVPVEAKVERGLECRGDRDPECETRDRSDQCADRADDCAVREQHESKVLLGRADRSEHAELAEPSLRDDGEACRGNERSQQHEDGGHGEHRQLGCRLVVTPNPEPHQGGPVALRFRERADRLAVGVDQDRDGVRCPGGRG